ncbi:hypothetical protein J1614_009971 [Plenodomus biglobosus]|nr:hypothetical protein J1614_009971 [Plenodomus biglobosus]
MEASYSKKYGICQGRHVNEHAQFGISRARSAGCVARRGGRTSRHADQAWFMEVKTLAQCARGHSISCGYLDEATARGGLRDVGVAVVNRQWEMGEIAKASTVSDLCDVAFRWRAVS